MTDLDELDRLYAEASRGAWGVSSGWEQCDPGVFIYAESGGPIVYAPEEDDEKATGQNLSLNDATFTVAMHNAYPALRTAIRELEEELREWRCDTVEGRCHGCPDCRPIGSSGEEG